MTVSLGPPDFARLQSNLAPSGDAWPREPDAVLQQVFLALAGVFARLNDRANALVIDAFPGTTEELLPEWEASLGLPDPCSGPNATVQERRAHVVARLTQTDGPSIPSLTAFAATLGYQIEILEYTPMRFGQRFGRRFAGTAWAFTWTVIALGPGPNAVLECELRRLSPAHTLVGFVYSAPLGSFVLGTNSLG